MAGQTPTGLSWECPRCKTANPASDLRCRACGRSASVNATPTVWPPIAPSATTLWTPPPPPPPAATTASRSSRPLVFVVALLLAAIVSVAGAVLVLQGQGGQSATEPVAPVDDAGTLRAGWGGWVIATYQNDPTTGAPVALAMLDGEDPARGRLAIGCADGINSVSVQWNEFLGNATSDLEVEVSLDGEASEPMQWEITGEADATILRGDEAADFAASLYGKTGLDLRTMALDAERVSLRFDITEIEEVVPLVREHCGW